MREEEGVEVVVAVVVVVVGFRGLGGGLLVAGAGVGSGLSGGEEAALEK